MAIKKQNRTLIIFVIVTLVILGYVLNREGKLADLFGIGEVKEEGLDRPASDQDSMGDQVGGSSVDAAQRIENQKAFAQILGDLSECLDIKSPEASGEAPVELETLLQQFQGELGPINHQSDRWMNWHLRNNEGKERRLRLEITENDEGKIGRELHYFAVDRDGQPLPIEIEPEKANNPSDDIVNQMLKEGEVFYKERAAYVVFPGGERAEYVEKNGELAEIEFVKGEKFYRCNNLKARENCQCVR